jgi:uncharacterized protein YdhG (YjbR/CyaY superfamily)
MAKTDFKSADEYIKTFPADKQAILKQVRETIRKAVPDAEEVISYQVPAFRLAGGWVFYYSMYTSHFSLACPPPFAAFKEFAKELSRYKQSKSAVNFPLDEPVPVKLIAQMSKFQVADIAARAKDKAKVGVKVKAKTNAKTEAKAKAKTGAKAKAEVAKKKSR